MLDTNIHTDSDKSYLRLTIKAHLGIIGKAPTFLLHLQSNSLMFFKFSSSKCNGTQVATIMGRADNITGGNARALKREGNGTKTGSALTMTYIQTDVTLQVSNETGT